MDDLHNRIAETLGWTVKDTQSMSLASLRELVRGVPGKEKLVHELNTRIQSGSVIIGPVSRRRATAP